MTNSGRRIPREHEEEEYAELRESLRRAVLRVCPTWLLDKSDDIIQAALMRVMDIQRRSEGQREFRPAYLSKVAHSAMVDKIRKLRRRQEVPLENEEGTAMPLPAAVISPEQSTRSVEISRGLQECLKTLIRPRRRAVVMRLLGHTVPEAAERLGWEVKRTENLVYRGLENLRECLKSKGLKP
ncbi:MAG TPA: sigma-70 family RNA polymerase sigma factor [Acidobacteriota bacterium]|nr:sigma-70 family RNA polymerase sigma factor [Acidobacteriota bacterium]